MTFFCATAALRRPARRRREVESAGAGRKRAGGVHVPAVPTGETQAHGLAPAASSHLRHARRKARQGVQNAELAAAYKVQREPLPADNDAALAPRRRIDSYAFRSTLNVKDIETDHGVSHLLRDAQYFASR
jgi:hypothetical protein